MAITPQKQPYKVELESIRTDGPIVATDTIIAQGQTEVRVLIRSQAKPGILAQVETVLDRKLITVAAGACAEHLAKRYGDDIDPDRAAMTAERGFDGFVAALNKNRSGVAAV